MGTADLIERAVAWARNEDAPALQADLVAGANETERSILAALGGAVTALAGKRAVASWPIAVQEWCSTPVRPPQPLLRDLRAALVRNRQLLPQLYERSVSGRNRRRLGTFFTPDPVVRFMVARAASVQRRPANIVDPGAGVGAFTLAAARRWPGASIKAVDLNVVTLGLLGLGAHVDGIENVELVHADYLEWLDNSSDATGPRILLGNPPYTRHQEIDSKLKKLIAERGSGLIDSQLAGLSAYFMAASLESLGPKDSLCFVVPTNWAETRYGRGLRSWLWESTDRAVSIHTFPPAVELFPGTKVAALILTIGQEQSKQPCLTFHDASLTGSAVKSSSGRRQPRTGEAPPTLGPLLWQQRSRASQSPNTTTLGSVARVRRGVATGANHFFFLNDAQRDELPAGAVVPAIRRLRHVEGDLLGKAAHDAIGLAGHPRWLLHLDDKRLAKNKAVAALLARGEREGLRNRRLIRVRDPWYVVEQVEAPDILVAMMGTARIRAVRNRVQAVPSNSMYGIYLRRRADAERLCSWLNSAAGQQTLLAAGVHYSGGLRKLEPRTLLQIQIPTTFA